MTASEAFASDGARLLSYFGQTIIRWPQGNSATPANITANVDLDEETSAGQVGGGTRVRDEAGERICRTGKLDVAASQAIDDRDIFVISSERWQVVRILGRDDGGKTVLIERVEPIRTAKGRRRDL